MRHPTVPALEGTVPDLIFDGFDGLIGVLVKGGFAYVAVVVMLRWAGLRTLSKMNSYDFVVTIALGSVLASVIMSSQVSIAEGLVGMGVLIALQLGVTWFWSRWRHLHDAATACPTLLLQHGNMIEPALRDTRVTPAEVRAALRSAGMHSLEQAQAVVLEADGSLSVLAVGDQRGESTLQGVRRVAP